MTALQPDDQQLLISAVRDFARAELIDRDRVWDETETSCCTEFETVHGLGLLSLRVPEQDGGLDCPFVPYAAIIRELSYASPSVAVTVAVHTMVCEIVRRFAAPPVQRRMLPILAQLGNLAAFAISEPNAGSDPGAAQTRAQRADGGWKLTGPKMWVTNGINGRWFVVLARTDPNDGARELSMFLMDAQQPGVVRRPIHGKMGIRGSETAEMSLEEAFIPDDHLLGEPGWGLRIALSALDGGRIGIASQALGIASAACDLMREYSCHREQFGAPISSFQAIQWMLADSAVEIAAAQKLIDRAAWLKDQGRAHTSEASMAKLFASEAAARIVDRAVQSHGGYGFVREFRVEQLYRDARITRLYEGTSEIQRVVIARNLLRD